MWKNVVTGLAESWGGWAVFLKYFGSLRFSSIPYDPYCEESIQNRIRSVTNEASEYPGNQTVLWALETMLQTVSPLL